MARGIGCEVDALPSSILWRKGDPVAVGEKPNSRDFLENLEDVAESVILERLLQLQGTTKCNGKLVQHF